MAESEHDSWGNNLCITDTSGVSIGTINPFRYKGYYYDTETGLFYCNSRYYNPEWGRWISPDSIDYLDPESINGLNLYAYCGNDPVYYVDPSGHAWYDVLAYIGIGIVIAFAIVLTAGVGSMGVAGFIVAGAAKGALIGAASSSSIAYSTRGM